jgi:filamentous hemagglutinin family protein
MRKRTMRLAVLGALMGVATIAQAAVPAGSLPGSFQSSVSATYTGSGRQGTITFNSTSPQVMQWGGTPSFSGQTVQAPSGVTTNAGFDIGQGASLTITNNQGTKGSGLLVIDATGNPSEIAGSLINSGTPEGIFVANSNGVTVDGTATISGPTGAFFGILGYTPDANTFLSTNAVTIDGSTPTNNGTMTIAPGANLSGVNTLLVAGNGAVNIGASNLSGSNAANNAFVVSAGDALKVTNTIHWGLGSINPNAVLTLSGGTASNPMELDGVQGGVVNVTGNVAGDPSATSNTLGAGQLRVEYTNALNIDSGASVSGSDVSLFGVPVSGRKIAGNVNIYGTVTATGGVGAANPGGDVYILRANSILEWGSGSVNFPNATAVSDPGELVPEFASDWFNPTNYHAHNGNLLYGGFNINAGNNGSGSVVVYPDAMIGVPGLDGQPRKYADIAVNGTLTLFDPPASLGYSYTAPAGTLPDSQSGLGQFLVASATGNIVLGSTINGTEQGFYWPGFLGVVNVTPGNPGALNPDGLIGLRGPLSNAVAQTFQPTGLFTSGGLYLLSLNPIQGISSSNTITTNENSNITVSGLGSGNAAYYVNNGYNADMYHYVLNGTSLTPVNVNPVNSSAQ